MIKNKTYLSILSNTQWNMLQSYSATIHDGYYSVNSINLKLSDWEHVSVETVNNNTPNFKSYSIYKHDVEGVQFPITPHLILELFEEIVIRHGYRLSYVPNLKVPGQLAIVDFNENRINILEGLHEYVTLYCIIHELAHMIYCSIFPKPLNVDHYPVIVFAYTVLLNMGIDLSSWLGTEMSCCFAANRKYQHSIEEENELKIHCLTKYSIWELAEYWARSANAAIWNCLFPISQQKGTSDDG